MRNEAEEEVLHQNGRTKNNDKCLNVYRCRVMRTYAAIEVTPYARTHHIRLNDLDARGIAIVAHNMLFGVLRGVTYSQVRKVLTVVYATVCTYSQ